MPTRAPRSFLPQGKVRKGQLADFAVIAILVLGLVEMGGVSDAIQEPNRMGNGRPVRNAGAGSKRSRRGEHYTRLRDAWTTLAKRCEPFNFPAEVLETKSDLIRYPLEVTAACKRISTRRSVPRDGTSSNQKYSQPCFT